MPGKRDYDLTTLYFPNRIMDKLRLIKSYPITIVEAPSGFGKTTAVRAFFDKFISESIPVYWHTFLGESFHASWKSLCNIFARADSESADRLLELGTPDEDSVPLVTEILENMECNEEIYVVLDNFQDIGVAFINRLLEALAKQGGEKLHVLIVTQQLSVEGALITGQNHRIYKISAQDLKFTKSDAADYYKQVGLRITPRQLDSVYSRSDGWIAALYLHMLAFVQTGSFETGDMEKLLHTAMWGKLSSDKQNVLLALSVFNSFTLQQLDFMREGISGFSEAELRENPFIRFDRETGSYYMHSILQTYLTQQFENMTEEFKTKIYLRSGDWFGKTGSYIDALRFYHQAGAYEKIFALPLTSLDVADHAVGENVRPIILDLLDKTGYEVKLLYPQSMINIAFALFFLGEHQRLMGLQGEITDIIQNCGLLEKQKMALAGEMELLMSFLEYNKIDKMSERHLKALELIGGPTSLINIKSTWTFGSPSVLYLYHRESGKLAEELAQMDECMPHYYRLSNGHGSGAEIVMRAEAEFFAGNLDAAETLCHKALFVSDSKKQNSIYQCALFLLVRIFMMRGDLENMRAARTSLRERAKLSREDLCRHTIDLCDGFINVTLDEQDNLPLWLSQGDISERYLSIMVVPSAHIIYGRALLGRREYLKLLGASEYFMGISGIFSNVLPQIYTKIYMAQASAALGKEAEAVRLLADALEIALPDKLYMPFAENGEGIKNLLPKAAELITDKGCIDKINELACIFRESVGKIKADRPVLTDREQEVCTLIAEGLTNKQIADRLFISLSTVKTLVSRILEKMGVTSRTQLAGLKR